MTCLFAGCWRFALCIGYWIPTWGHLSLANVGRSSSAGALALFHCIWATNRKVGFIDFLVVFYGARRILTNHPCDLGYLFLAGAWATADLRQVKSREKNCPVLSQVTDDWHLNLHFALTT